jgi:hypothetical protein
MKIQSLSLTKNKKHFCFELHADPQPSFCQALIYTHM